MANQVPYELKVANSNPNSRFSHFLIVSVIEVVHPRFDEPYIETVEDLDYLEEHPYSHSEPFYIVYGEYAGPFYPHPQYGGARELRRFPDLKDAQEFLVELNGAITEDNE